MFRSIRLSALIVLTLVFSLLVGSIGIASQPAYAQDPTSLTQLVASANGGLSVRLPATWVAIDDTGNAQLALFSTILFFGENQAAAEARRAYNMGQTSNVPGMGGAVVIVDPAQFQQLAGQPLTPDSAVAAVVAGTEANGGSTQVGATAYQTSAGNPAVYAVTSDPNSDLLAFIVAVDFSGTIVLASTENRTADFAGSSDLLTAILDSVSAPAEAPTTPTTGGGGLGGGLGGTGLVSGESDDNAFVTSDDGSLSILLPEDWVFEDQLATNGIVVFGENQAEADNRATFWLSNQLVTVAGSGGFVAEIEWSSIPADPATFDLNAGFTGFLANLSHSEAEPFQEITIGGQTPAIYTVITYPTQKTFVGLIAFDLKLAIVAASAPNATFEANRNLLLEIIQSVSIPAGQPPATDPGTTGLGGGTGLGGSTASTGQTVAASDSSLSVVLPDGWVSQDNMASGGYFAFGENGSELQNRITFWESDQDIAITGLGGIITLYDYANLGYTADTMDPVVTLDTFISNLSLVTVQPTQTFNIAGVVASYAIVEWGASQGVLMIIPFQERLALVYASTTAANINSDLAILLSVAETVRVPAETGGGGGLGGGTTGAGGGKKGQ